MRVDDKIWKEYIWNTKYERGVHVTNQFIVESYKRYATNPLGIINALPVPQYYYPDHHDLTKKSTNHLTCPTTVTAKDFQYYRVLGLEKDLWIHMGSFNQYMLVIWEGESNLADPNLFITPHPRGHPRSIWPPEDLPVNQLPIWTASQGVPVTKFDRDEFKQLLESVHAILGHNMSIPPEFFDEIKK